MAGKTEWEDALIKHGIMQAPVVGPTEDELHLEHVEKLRTKDVHEDKSLDELDELEDDLDDDLMSKYREKRLAEMKDRAKREIFGRVVSIGQTEFIKEVSEASKEHWVLCHLYVSGKPECQVLDKCLERLAAKFRDLKICKIVSIECIPNYPDKNCPTLLVYHKNDMVKQIVGLGDFGGMKATPESVEWSLAQIGVLQTELEESPLVRLAMNVQRKGQVRSRAVDSDDSDSD